MRAPFQILVIPFRRTAAGPEFAVLKRSDAPYWQFVAGGGEDDESPGQAAERETKEEIGVAANGRLLQLDSVATVGAALVAAPMSSHGRHLGSHKGCPYKTVRGRCPKRATPNCFAAGDSWGQEVYVIPEYCFAIDAGDSADRKSVV
jgi:8-oxo-dGTP pyrophosphatase MutT (NUDIX family)